MSKRRSSIKKRTRNEIDSGFSVEDPFDNNEWESSLETLSDYDIDAYSNFVHGEGLGLSRFTPEVRLRIAALGDAIWCLQRNPRKSRRSNEHTGITANKVAAKSWINGECQSEPTFSFIEVCEIIGLDPDATREAIYAMLKRRKFDIRELVFWLK